MGRRRGSMARVAMVLLAAAATVGCTTAATPFPTLGTTPGVGHPTPRPLPSGPRFDPSSISVSLQPFAHVAGGPLAIAAPDDGSGRLFVAAQDGRAWVVDRDGSTRPTPLLDLRSRITTGGERGLLGIAPHPGFAADPRVFVDYTDLQGNTVVASYRISAADPDRLDPASEVDVLAQVQPFPNHNGGALAFGPDGDLYVSFGDGGGAGDPQGNGQSLTTLLGKILRIDVDVPAGAARPYAIPEGNPSNGHDGVRPEIWLYGLRNPWRMSFDRTTGDLWLGDVGQGAWEEVDVARAGQGGLDFGWNRMEGAHCYKPASGCDTAGLTMPVAEYGHGDGCVVIGGDVYRGSRFPRLAGAYLFLDYCSGRIWALDAERTEPSATPAAPIQVGMTAGQAAAFGEDQAGELYVARLTGDILRVIATAR